MSRLKNFTIALEVDEFSCLTCKGTYSPAYTGSYDNPPEPAEFEIEEVRYMNIDITKVLDMFPSDTKAQIFDFLNRKCLEALENDYGKEMDFADE